METTLAILMVLGIFVGIPAVIGLAIGGAYILRDRQSRKAEHADTLKEVAVAEDTVGVAKA
jgi:hypothetical protein